MFLYFLYYYFFIFQFYISTFCEGTTTTTTPSSRRCGGVEGEWAGMGIRGVEPSHPAVVAADVKNKVPRRNFTFEM